MGYSATMLETDTVHSGDGCATLHAKCIEVHVLPALRLAESADWPGGHISWCDPIDTYTGTPSEIVAAVLIDYGFDDVTANDDGSVTIGWWGGDKIGGSWDGVCNAIALGITAPTRWLMQGEDNAFWYEHFDGNGGRTSGGARITPID